MSLELDPEIHPVSSTASVHTLSLAPLARSSTTSPTLSAYLTACTSTLTSLDLSETEALDPDILPALAALPALSSLSLAWTAWIPDPAPLISLFSSASAPHLASLNLSVVPCVDDDVLASIAAGASAASLTHLDIGGCHAVSPAAVAALVAAAPLLTHIEWPDRDEPSDAPKAVLLDALMAAKQSEWAVLAMDRASLATDAVLEPLWTAPGLAGRIRSLSLAGCSSPHLSTGAAAALPPTLPLLSSLNLSGTALSSAAIVALLAKAPALTALTLDACPGTDAAVLAALPQTLESLSLARTEPGSPAALASAFARVSSLASLDISSTCADDTVAAALAQLPSLTALYAAGCDALTTAGIELLARLPLAILDISDTHNIAALRLPGLAVLDTHGSACAIADLSASELLVVVTPPGHTATEATPTFADDADDADDADA